MLSSSSLKIKYKPQNMIFHVLAIVMVLDLLLPSYFVEAVPSYGFLTLRIISRLMMLLYVVSFGFRPTRPFWLITIISFCGILSTFFNRGMAISVFAEYIFIIVECAFLLSVIKSDEQSYILMTVIKNVTLIFALTNLLVGIVMPAGIPSFYVSGIYGRFLYGNVNSMMRCIMPGICCSMLLDKRKGKVISISTILLFLSIAYFFRVYFMATTFIGIVLLIMWIVLKVPFKQNYVKVYLAIVLVVLFVEIFVVFLFGNSSYASLISGLFSMKKGFSGRERLWLNIIRRIQNRRIWGYGNIDQEQMLYLIGNTHGSHNYYLDVVFRRGIVGFVPLLLLFLQPIIDKRENISDSCYILLGCCCAYFLMFLMEPFVGTEYLHLPIFCVAMSLLLKEKKWKARVKRKKYL